jgi:hypothetical protein
MDVKKNFKEKVNLCEVVLSSEPHFAARLDAIEQQNVMPQHRQHGLRKRKAIRELLELMPGFKLEMFQSQQTGPYGIKRERIVEEGVLKKMVQLCKKNKALLPNLSTSVDDAKACVGMWNSMANSMGLPQLKPQNPAERPYQSWTLYGTPSPILFYTKIEAKHDRRRKRIVIENPEVFKTFVRDKTKGIDYRLEPLPEGMKMVYVEWIHPFDLTDQFAHTVAHKVIMECQLPHVGISIHPVLFHKKRWIKVHILSGTSHSKVLDALSKVLSIRLSSLKLRPASHVPLPASPTYCLAQQVELIESQIHPSTWQVTDTSRYFCISKTPR